jgi:hypothetical protein
VLWSTRIARSQETFEPGFYYSKSFGAYLTGAAQFNSATTGARNYNLDSLGVQTYWSQLRLDSATAQSDDDFMAQLSKMCIHELASGKGMVRFLNTNAGLITVVAQGLVDKAWAGKVEEDVDGQGVFHLDPTSGQITKSVPVKFVVEDNESTIPDVYHFHTPIPSVHGTSILGTKSITLVQHNGDVDVANFPADEFINSIGYGADYRVVSYEDEGDHFATWKLLLTPEGIKKQLIGYADEAKHLCVFSDTMLVSTTQRFEGGTLSVYPLMSEVPKQWPSPLWKMDEDALDKLNIGSLEATVTSNDVLGIHPHGDVILMLGEEGFSYADAKTGCVKSIQWEGWTSGQTFKRSLRLFDPVKGGYLFDMGPSAGVIKVNGSCDITRIGYSEEKPDDLWIVYSDVTARIVFVNTADNMLNIFQVDR